AARRPAGGRGDRARELHDAVAAAGIPERARAQPAGAVPRGPCRGRGDRLCRHVDDGRRGAHHDLRGAPGVAASADRRATAAQPGRHRARPSGARGDARGPPVEPRRAASLREVRLPARRPPPELLQRRPRGCADHDHRAADGAADDRPHRRPPGATGREPCTRAARARPVRSSERHM
ncbi:MAG: Ribosomal-protein-S18p-alanine acetyltransferase, partial [uncultured Thermoleophilia bacterium]